MSDTYSDWLGPTRRTSRVAVLWLGGLALSASIVLASPLVAQTAAQDSPSSEEVWSLLSSSELSADLKSGGFQIAHKPSTRTLSGRQLTLSGVVIWRSEVNPGRFMLSQGVSGCPACDLVDPTKHIDVWSNSPAPFVGSPAEASGRFEISTAKADEGVFRLVEATARAL